MVAAAVLSAPVPTSATVCGDGATARVTHANFGVSLIEGEL